MVSVEYGELVVKLGRMFSLHVIVHSFREIASQILQRTTAKLNLGIKSESSLIKKKIFSQNCFSKFFSLNWERF